MNYQGFLFYLSEILHVQLLLGEETEAALTAVLRQAR